MCRVRNEENRREGAKRIQYVYIIIIKIMFIVLCYVLHREDLVVVVVTHDGSYSPPAGFLMS